MPVDTLPQEVEYRPGIQRIGLGKSIVRRIWSGALKLYYGGERLVAHDADGVVHHEFPASEEVKNWNPETLKSERDPSGEFPFPESKIRGGACR